MEDSSLRRDILLGEGLREMKPFTNVPRIGRFGDELSSESLEQEEHFLANSVDVHDFRQIND